MYNVYNYCTAYIACCFGGEFFILGDESEEGEDAMQLLSSTLQNQPNSKSSCAFQLLEKKNLNYPLVNWDIRLRNHASGIKVVYKIQCNELFF